MLIGHNITFLYAFHKRTEQLSALPFLFNMYCSHPFSLFSRRLMDTRSLKTFTLFSCTKKYGVFLCSSILHFLTHFCLSSIINQVLLYQPSPIPPNSPSL